MTNARFAAIGLMLGNFITGMTVLAPAGMMQDLSVDLAVSVRDVGLLIAWGGLTLCIGSPLVAWMTSAMDRRLVLTASLAAMAIGQVASALAPNYEILLGVRVVMLAMAAIFTPAAAGAIALIVPERDRARSIAFIFLGWSMSLAAGLPLITFVSGLLGWRLGYAMLAAIALVACIAVATTLAPGLRGAALSLASWGAVFRNRRIMLLLLVTLLWTSGFYIVFPYIGPLVAAQHGAGVSTTAILFGALGTMGLTGNIIATRVVTRHGAYRTGLGTVSSMLIGSSLWALAGGSIEIMIAGCIFCGLGTASTNSMIQARLVGIAPAAASATVALNTSWLYIGQAMGSWLGGELISAERFAVMGPAAVVFILAALTAMLFSREPAAQS